MNCQRRHHKDLDIAVEQYVEAIQAPTQRGRNECALLCGSYLGESWDSGGGHGRGDSISLERQIYHRGTETRMKAYDWDNSLQWADRALTGAVVFPITRSPDHSIFPWMTPFYELEVSLRPLHILPDLLLQRVNRRKFDLGPAPA